MKAFYNPDEILLSVTNDEIRLLRDACACAFAHWRKLANKHGVDNMNYSDAEIAKTFATLHDELATIFNELPF